VPRQFGLHNTFQTRKMILSLFKPNVSKRAATGDIAGLIRALEYKRDQRVRAAAARALGVAVARCATPALIKALSDEYEYVRNSAAEALGIIADQDAVKPLTGALKDKNEGVRKDAAIALGKVGERQAVPSLVETLSDDEWEVRRAAAEALGKLSDTRAVPPLIDALQDPIYDVRIAAAISLGELGHMRAVEPLTKLLNDIIPSVRAAVLSALDMLCDPKIEMKTDRNVQLRREMRELVSLKRHKPQSWTARSVHKRREYSRFGTCNAP